MMKLRSQAEVENYFLCLASGTTLNGPITIKEGDSFKVVISRVVKNSIYNVKTEYKVLTLGGREVIKPKVPIDSLETAIRQFENYQEKMRF